MSSLKMLPWPKDTGLLVQQINHFPIFQGLIFKQLPSIKYGKSDFKVSRSVMHHTEISSFSLIGFGLAAEFYFVLL